MKISWIKSQEDNKNFKFIERLGIEVIITQELAGFSEDIIKKYSKNKDIKIIINKN